MPDQRRSSSERTTSSNPAFRSVGEKNSLFFSLLNTSTLLIYSEMLKKGIDDFNHGVSKHYLNYFLVSSCKNHYSQTFHTLSAMVVQCTLLQCTLLHQYNVRFIQHDILTDSAGCCVQPPGCCVVHTAAASVS